MQTIVFPIWCVLINGMLFFAEADFLLRFCDSRRNGWIVHYVLLNTVLTVTAIWTERFVLFSLIHMALLFFFSIKFFRIPVTHIVTPAIIIFVLSTFREAFVAVPMQFLSTTLDSPRLGLFFQLMLPAALGILFFLALRQIAKRYPLMNGTQISPYLYILLLPGALMIAGIRTGLGLDRRSGVSGLGAWLSANPSKTVYALLWMAGILVVFFIIIEVFYKIELLSGQEMERVLLVNEMKEQRSYIDEARKRNEGYRSFQHDINNHLLVLSGLIASRQHTQAEEYLQKLSGTARSLSEEIATGNSVLDILLWEKIQYAKQNHITVTCDVRIPKDSSIDDIDLCILFANALDNAIKACADAEDGYRTIVLSARPKHSFLLIEIVNGIRCLSPFSYGTGLKNIELTAKKYAGAVHTQQAHNRFILSILLCCKNQSP